jgi:LCP family protein required for cell wall assembly
LPKGKKKMSETPNRKKKNKRKRFSAWKWIVLSLLFFVVGIIGFYGYSIVKFGQGINKDAEDSRFSQFYKDRNVAAEPADPVPKWEGKERVNILLLGGDERGLRKNEVPRSDTMMLVSIDPVTKTAHLISILRDTYAEIPGYGRQRVNAALALGGPELAMETVGNLLDVSVQYFVYVDFQGFISLIDAIGGVEFYVEKNMRYSTRADGPEYDINLEEGWQVLDGKKALQYVRFRNDARGDYARTERQREFMKAVANKLQSTTSLVKLPQILEKIEPHIETNMTLTDMLKLGALAFEIRNETIHSMQAPPQELLREENIGGASVITVDRDELVRYVHEQFELAAMEPEDETEDLTGDAGGHAEEGQGQTAEDYTKLQEVGS